MQQYILSGVVVFIDIVQREVVFFVVVGKDYLGLVGIIIDIVGGIDCVYQMYGYVGDWVGVGLVDCVGYVDFFVVEVGYCDIYLGCFDVFIQVFGDYFVDFGDFYVFYLDFIYVGVKYVVVVVYQVFGFLSIVLGVGGDG